MEGQAEQGQERGASRAWHDGTSLHLAQDQGGGTCSTLRAAVETMPEPGGCGFICMSLLSSQLGNWQLSCWEMWHKSSLASWVSKLSYPRTFSQANLNVPKMRAWISWLLRSCAWRTISYLFQWCWGRGRDFLSLWGKKIQYSPKAH